MSITFTRRINSEGLALIKKWEGCRLQAYLCAANVWTIGYGHTLNVREGDKISQDKAELLLLTDLDRFEKGVDKLLIHENIHSNQFSACVSLAFNIGLKAFAGSEVCKHANQGRFDLAANSFRNWRRGGGQVLQGLVNRREDEIQLFNKRGRESV